MFVRLALSFTLFPPFYTPKNHQSLTSWFFIRQVFCKICIMKKVQFSQSVYTYYLKVCYDKYSWYPRCIKHFVICSDVKFNHSFSKWKAPKLHAGNVNQGIKKTHGCNLCCSNSLSKITSEAPCLTSILE